jgi:deazaflavin-dependent oxidoreductase (nitroreductase family)
MKVKFARLFWRVVNPIANILAGVAPWWVVLETRGNKTGARRRAPLARGPVDGNVTWVIAVHGQHAGFVRNIEANPHVRLRLNGRWRNGTAAAQAMEPAVVERFNAYARSGPKTLGWDPLLVRIELTD